MDKVEIHADWIKEGKLPELKTMENTIEREYQITLECLELTTFCPLTKQPDYGRITINYAPNKWCVETKSLKEYLVAYRDKDMFQEEIPNQILHDLWSTVSPRWMTVMGEFNIRGGISERVQAQREEMDE